MTKKLILVASPPASGKTYVSERLAAARGMVYLDKDDLAPLLRASFAAAGQEIRNTERMAMRNSDRDTGKLLDWERYVKTINYNPPYELEEAGAVDRFLLFDSKDEESFGRSMSLALKIITGEES